MSADLHSKSSIFVCIVEFTAVLLFNLFGALEYSYSALAIFDTVRVLELFQTSFYTKGAALVC